MNYKLDEFDVTVLNYLGEVNGGIITLITISFPKEELVFDATFYYTDTQMILTIPENVEELIGDIKKLPQYPEILKACLRKVVPHHKLIDSIDPLDVRPFLDLLFPNDSSTE